MGPDKTKTATFAAIAGLFLASTGCLKGPGFMQQDSASKAALIVPVDEKAGGAVTGSVSSSASATQVLKASSDSKIAGAGVEFPPGSLAVDTEVTVEEGADVASETFAGEAGLDDSTKVEGASSSVVVSSSEKKDPAQPMTIKVPVDGESSLRLAEDERQIVIVYKVERHRDGKILTGVIPTQELAIKDGFVRFEMKYFGSFQVAYTNKKIDERIEAESDTPILTKREEEKLKEPSWKKPTAELLKKRRLVRTSSSVDVETVGCAVISDRDKEKPWDRIRAVEGLSRVKAAAAAPGKHRTKVRFSCRDEFGRTIRSPWSAGVEVYALKASIDVVQEPDSSNGGELIAAINGPGVAAYKYGYIDSSEGCDAADYGSWIEASKDIQETVPREADGLCVLGRDRGGNVQETASSLGGGSVDDGPSPGNEPVEGNYTLRVPLHAFAGQDIQVEWTQEDGALGYYFQVHNRPGQCGSTTEPVYEENDYPDTSIVISGLPPGTYFFCHSAYLGDDVLHHPSGGNHAIRVLPPLRLSAFSATGSVGGSDLQEEIHLLHYGPDGIRDIQVATNAGPQTSSLKPRTSMVVDPEGGAHVAFEQGASSPTVHMGDVAPDGSDFAPVDTMLDTTTSIAGPSVLSLAGGPTSPHFVRDYATGSHSLEHAYDAGSEFTGYTDIPSHSLPANAYWDASLALDKDGIVWVGFSHPDKGSGVIASSSDESNVGGLGFWSDNPMTLPQSCAEWHMLELAHDKSDGSVHVISACAQVTANTCEVNLHHDLYDGSSWSNAQIASFAGERLTTDTDFCFDVGAMQAFDPSVAVAGDGTVHVSYLSHDAANDTYPVQYVRIGDDELTPAMDPLPLGRVLAGHDADAFKGRVQALTLDQNGRPYVFFVDYGDGDAVKLQTVRGAKGKLPGIPLIGPSAETSLRRVLGTAVVPGVEGRNEW